MSGPRDDELRSATADLSAVIVAWNTRDLLLACLTSLHREAAHARLAVETIVVDNGSTDGTVEAVRSGFPDVHLLVQPGNRGFAAASNLGIRAARGRAVLLLNPDTELHSGALGALWGALHAMPHVGLAGALLLNPDGSLQSAGYRFPGLAQQFLDFFPLHPRLAGSRLNGRYAPGDGLTPYAVDHPLGACMLMRREAIEQVGLLDEGYFMYSEEIDWCRRLRQAGWTVLTVPAARVIHYGGQSTGQVPHAMLVELHRSRARYFRRYQPRLLRPSAWLARLAARRDHTRAPALREAARLYREAAEAHANG